MSFFQGSKNPSVSGTSRFTSVHLARSRSVNHPITARSAQFGDTHGDHTGFTVQNKQTRLRHPLFLICDSLIYSVTELTADGFAMSRSLLKTSRKRAIFSSNSASDRILSNYCRTVCICSFSLRLTWVRWIILFFLFSCVRKSCN